MEQKWWERYTQLWTRLDIIKWSNPEMSILLLNFFFHTITSEKSIRSYNTEIKNAACIFQVVYIFISYTWYIVTNIQIFTVNKSLYNYISLQSYYKP